MALAKLLRESPRFCHRLNDFRRLLLIPPGDDGIDRTVRRDTDTDRGQVFVHGGESVNDSRQLLIGERTLVGLTEAAM